MSEEKTDTGYPVWRRARLAGWSAMLLHFVFPAHALATSAFLTGAPVLASEFEARLFALNRNVFWAPASGFSEATFWVNRFGDEARSVFGPIPELSCQSEFGIPFHAESAGHLIKVMAEDEQNGSVRYEKWTSSGEKSDSGSAKMSQKCDKPSLANTSGHPCGTNSRIAVRESGDNPNVAWVTLCRKSKSMGMTGNSRYWHKKYPRFALLGTIGFNRKTGEVVFFDGSDVRTSFGESEIFSWNQTYPPPGGSGYNDTEGRLVAYKTYRYTKQLNCEGCHDNKEPWIMTPHLKYAGIGYRNSERRAAFGLENPLPLVQPRSDEAPYRVIGTRYTSKADLSSKTFRDPGGSCTYCHTLTTDWTGKVLAYDAVGKVNDSDRYRPFFERINNAKTDWAKQKGNTHPWMVPWLGPNMNPGWEVTPISEGNWQRIAACINEASKEDCQYKNVYTSCPAPESTKTSCTTEDELNNTCTRLADPFGPSEMTVRSSLLQDDNTQLSEFDRNTTIAWTYLNGLGGVPQRDDVRFNMMIREMPIHNGTKPPLPEEYPSLKETADPYYSNPVKKDRIHYCDLGGKRTRSCNIFDPEKGQYFFNNISYADHTRNTTPEPTSEPRQYRLTLPTRCNTRYLVRLVPKRFCFDQSGVLPSKVNHVTYFDVRCEVN